MNFYKIIHTFLLIILGTSFILAIISPPIYDDILNNQTHHQNCNIPSQKVYNSTTKRIIPIWVSNNDYSDIILNNSKYELFNTEGNSMLPTTIGGHQMICDYSIKNYKIGMIVIYTDRHNFLVAHRIIDFSKDSKYLYIQGDNNDANIIEKVKQQSILCVVVGILF